MARPGRLDDDKVLQIRSIYARAREYSEDVGPDDEGYQTVTETEERLATTFGVSQPMIRRIVLGLSYANVGGPLDERRRASAKEVVNAVPPTMVEVTVAQPGKDPKVYTYPAGTVVSVVGVRKDIDDYSENGRPRRGTATSKAKDTPKAATAGEDESLHAALTRLERKPKRKWTSADDRRAADLRAALGRGVPDSAGNASGNI